jgi:hypothetical protein
MKFFHPILCLLLSSLIVGCSFGSETATATPRSAAAFQSVSPPAEIKPPESKQPDEAAVLDAPTIAYNEVKEGQIESPSAVDEWVFNAQAGERVNIVLNSQFDSYLDLRAPDGEFIASNDDSGESLNAALFDVPIRKSGPHTIVVRGYGGTTGIYGLALTGGHPTIGGGTLASGDSRQVVLSKQGFKWRYQGQQDTYLTVTIEAEALLDSRLALYGPDGILLTQDDDSGGGLNAEIYEFQLPADGAYTIQAQSTAETGLATLTLSSSPRASGGGPLVVGKTQAGTLKPGRSHHWSFVGEAGQIVNISLNSVDFDPFLEIRNSQNVILAENDDSEGSSNSALNFFTLPADDTYTLIARSAAPDAGGDYDISLKPVKVAPGGGPLVADQSRQALMLPGQRDTWSFEAEAGDFVTISLQSEQLDTYLELYGPDQALLIEDDDSGGGLNAALLDFSIPADGAYQLVVRAAREQELTGGVYQVLLTTAKELAAAGVLAAGDSLTQSLKAGEQHTWTFEAQEDEFVTAKMESPTLDTYLSLYDSSGELLAVNDDFLGKQAVIANFIVPEAGQYRLVARAYAADEAGDYTISLEITEEALPIRRSESNK